MELLRHPAHNLSKLLWDLARLRASHLCKHHTIAVALDELHGNVEIPQTRDRFIWHRAGKHIAPDHYLIYFCLTNILEYSLECGEVRVNIVNCSDPHNRTSSIERNRNSVRREGQRLI